MNFIGRENELGRIKELLSRPRGGALIYGKRKVGKTTLILQALKSSEDKTVYFQCDKGSEKSNARSFAKELQRAGVIPAALPFENFTDVFMNLEMLPGTYNVVMDEYPYLKAHEDPDRLDSEFQNIIDHHTPNIRLFISGSHIGMMRGMLEYGNALYGRFDTVIHLEEWDYKDASAVYASLSPYDRAAFYSVFGGSPFAGIFLDERKSLKENVIELYLRDGAPLAAYADHLLLSDASHDTNVRNILSALGNGEKKYGELENALWMTEKNGGLAKQLSQAMELGLIAKRFPVNDPDNRRKAFYETADNVMRFFYTFIEKDRSALAVLGPDDFYDSNIAPYITTFISHRFEDVCRQFLSRLVKEKRLPGGAMNIGTFWYDDAETKTNGEFDVAVLKKDACDVYEAKYLSSPMTRRAIERETEQIRNIKGLNVGDVGFISVNGFEEGCEGILYTGEDLYG